MILVLAFQTPYFYLQKERLVFKVYVPLSVTNACFLSTNMHGIPTKWQCVQWTELVFDMVLQEGSYMTLKRKYLSVS